MYRAVSQSSSEASSVQANSNHILFLSTDASHSGKQPLLSPTPFLSILGEVSMEQERRLASIFLSIVVAFFICHLPAYFLNIHEAATVNKLIYCLQRHKNGLPPWILCLHDVSSFFLVCVLQNVFLRY
jgi:hypothetical protein